MNVMFQLGDSLVTAPTGDTILQGITRDSVLKLATDLGIDVEERRISVEEIRVAHERGQLKDAFGVGTAATIAPIELIGFRGEDMILPPVGERVLSKKISDGLKAIRYGEVADRFGWMVSMN